MAFRVRTLLEVLDGMLATVVANSEITDVNRGAIDRILLEAAALQDADQYLQIARLKNAFSIETATGVDLDDRGADFGIDRLTPTQATGVVYFGDSNFTVKVETTLNGLHLSGVTSLTLTDASAFPATGSVILERDTPGQRELVTYSSKLGNVLTLTAPTTITHAALTSVILSTAGADRVFPSQSVVSVPATDSSDQLDFTTQAAVTLLDGDVATADVTVISALTGAALNVGSGQISDIANPPFQTATVTNDAPTQGGRDEETDAEYRQRIKQTIAALSNGTINDLLVAASAVELDNGQRVITAQVVEDFGGPPTILSTSLTLLAGIGSATLTVADASLLPASGAVVVEPTTPGQREVLTYYAKVGNVLSLSAVTTISHPASSVVVLSTDDTMSPDVSVYIDDGTGLVTTTATQSVLELLIHKAEPGQRRSRLANWPVVSGTLNLKKSAFQGGPGSPTTVNAVTPGVGTALLTITGAGFTPAALVGLTLVDDNRNTYAISANGANDVTVTVPVSYPNPVPGSYAIFPATFLSIGTDYLFNETTGDIELNAGLVLNAALAAVPNPVNSYFYYTGLIQEVQKVLNGDPDDIDNYPGVKASGVKLKVRAPTVQNVSFNITIISTFGTVEADLEASVKDVVQRYVNSLGIGADVVLAEVIAAVMSVPGVTDTRVNSPLTNIVVLDDVLPRTKSSLITIL